MDIDLQSLIKDDSRLPSLPSVAIDLLQTINDVDVDVATLASIIGHDPALAARLLRYSNSLLYAKQQRVETLTRAIAIMGLNASASIALGFSLSPAVALQNGTNLDYLQLWRRSVLAASAAMELGVATGELVLEELFLAGLLQDFGMLVIDRLKPGIYRELGDNQRDHIKVCELENRVLQGDHAEVGAALLRQWHLAERTVVAVENSHDPERLPLAHPLGIFTRCVALSGLFADFLMCGEDSVSLKHLLKQCETIAGLDRHGVDGILSRLRARIPELEALFSVELLTAEYPDEILKRAGNARRSRDPANARMSASANELQKKQSQTGDPHLSDPLTGAFSRKFFETYLPDILEITRRENLPLSVVFADISNFGDIRRRFGKAGDSVLSGVARILERNVRAGDVVVRYGDEIFLVILPGAKPDAARGVCNRILKACAELRLPAGGENVRVELAMGLVTHGNGLCFTSAQDLLSAANLALFEAKLSSIGKIVQFDRDEAAKPYST